MDKPDFKTAGRELKDELIQALDKRNAKVSGGTIGKIALRFNEGLDAKTTKSLKLKGLVTKDSLPRGFRIVTTTGLVMNDKDGNPEASDGESLIQWDESDTGLRVKTASDLSSLYIARPAQKVELGGEVDIHELSEPVKKKLDAVYKKKKRA